MVSQPQACLCMCFSRAFPFKIVYALLVASALLMDWNVACTPPGGGGLSACGPGDLAEVRAV